MNEKPSIKKVFKADFHHIMPTLSYIIFLLGEKNPRICLLVISLFLKILSKTYISAMYFNQYNLIQ
jgi:hypothetical protein